MRITMDLALNCFLWLIFHETKPNQWNSYTYSKGYIIAQRIVSVTVSPFL